jgi:predicted nucleic acid-binding protein
MTAPTDVVLAAAEKRGDDDDPHVGSLDAIHLACAQEIGTALDRFVTYDKTLARASAAAGLPLEQPS